jgi:hypothetical protein
MTLRTLMLGTVAALMLAVSPAHAMSDQVRQLLEAQQNNQTIEVTHPTFLEAAVFVITGRELNSDDPPGAMREANGDISVLGNRFSIIPDQPTLIKIVRGDTKMMETFDFNKLAGPNTAAIQQGPGSWGAATLKFAIVDGLGGYCKGPWAGAGIQVHMTCYDGTVEIVDPTNMWRRLQALTYIRANFAPGLPQPPIVVKPY